MPEHFRNSFKHARVFQMELELGKVGFWGVHEKTGNTKKESKDENNQQAQPTYDSKSGTRHPISTSSIIPYIF